MNERDFHPQFDRRRVELSMRRLPNDFRRMTDKYFTRTRLILEHLDYNPWMVGQIFARVKGGGTAKLAGVFDFLACFMKYSNFVKNGGRIWALPEGATFQSTDTVIVAEGHAQDWVELETVYLGLLSAATTQVNMGIVEINLGDVENKMRQIIRALRRRDRRFPPSDVTYFGARHYHPFADEFIYLACRKAGIRFCSTDGAAHLDEDEGYGTTPHVLESLMRYRHGEEQAVVTAIRYFDEIIDPRVRRVSLVDYRNKELDDAALVIKELGSRLHSFRLDTAGENVAQGAIPTFTSPEAKDWLDTGRYLPNAEDPIAPFWVGRGVTVSAAYALKHWQRVCGFQGSPAMLTSGFSNVSKVHAFVDAEALLNEDLLSGGIGVGEVAPGIFFKMDAMAIGDNPEQLTIVHKAGRPPKANWALLPALGDFSGNPLNPYARIGLTQSSKERIS